MPPIYRQFGIGHTMTIDAIKSDFDFLDEWEDRYRYVIELGRALPDFPEALRTESNKVRGCASQVWLATAPQTTSAGKPGMSMQGMSDAMIVQGLIAVLFALYNDRSLDEILSIDAQATFAELGLKEHLTPQRSNGLVAMVERIRTDARELATA
jgi:cysteine desulfuration protein SufE